MNILMSPLRACFVFLIGVVKEARASGNISTGETGNNIVITFGYPEKPSAWSDVSGQIFTVGKKTVLWEGPSLPISPVPERWYPLNLSLEWEPVQPVWKSF